MKIPHQVRNDKSGLNEKHPAMLRGACASWTRWRAASSAAKELAEEGGDPAADEARGLADQPDDSVEDSRDQAFQHVRDDLFRAKNREETVEQ